MGCSAYRPASVSTDLDGTPCTPRALEAWGSQGPHEKKGPNLDDISLGKSWYTYPLRLPRVGEVFIYRHMAQVSSGFFRAPTERFESQGEGEDGKAQLTHFLAAGCLRPKGRRTSIAQMSMMSFGVVLCLLLLFFLLLLLLL